MSCNILYRIADGQILEANFGPVSSPNGTKSIVQADFIPNFDEYYVLAGVLTRRTQAQIDAIRLARQQAIEARELRKASDKADWLANTIHGKTPSEVKQIVTDRITSITTLAQAKTVLTELLPVMAAGIVALAYRELEE